MAVEIPGWLRPFYDRVGPPFPDINEDEFLALRGPLEEFAQGIVDLCSTLERALSDLAAGSSSSAIESVAQHLHRVRQAYLEPFRRGVDEVSGSPLQFLHDVVRGVKWALITEAGVVATANVIEFANSVDSLGLSDAAAIAEDAGLREATREALRIAESELEAHLVSELQHRAEALVNEVVRPFLGQLESDLEGVINQFSPTFARGVTSLGMGGSSGTLHVSIEELLSCAHRIEAVRDEVESSIGSMKSAVEGLFASGADGGPNPDPALRVIARDLVHVFVADCTDAFRNLLHGVIDHFSQLLKGIASATEAMNAQIAAAGAQPPHASVLRTAEEMATGLGVALSQVVVGSASQPDPSAAPATPTEVTGPTDSTTGTTASSAPSVPQVVDAAPTDSTTGTTASSAPSVPQVVDAAPTPEGVASTPAGATGPHVTEQQATAGAASTVTHVDPPHGSEHPPHSAVQGSGAAGVPSTPRKHVPGHRPPHHDGAETQADVDEKPLTTPRAPRRPKD